MELLTYNLLFVFLELDIAIRLDEHLDEHHAVLGSAAYALHEARIADALLVLHILQLRNVYTCRAGGGRREGEALAHGFCYVEANKQTSVR
jgi:hypothetical protein